MQFKHPEILYALFLLIIPIIVHLFQLQRFVKIPFTNVKFLKTIEQQTRKSAKLKKRLILITRMLIFTCLIFAFSQPYFADNTIYKNSEVNLFIDNSMSMQAKGPKGELLQSVIQDIIEKSEFKNTSISLITNSNRLDNLNENTLKNELLNLNYHANSFDLNKSILEFSSANQYNSKTLYKNILISDFQYISHNNKNVFTNLNTPIELIKMVPSSEKNVYVDSLFVSNSSIDEITLSAIISSHLNNRLTIPISLYNNDVLMGKTTVKFDNSNRQTVEFKIPQTSNFNGKISLVDSDLAFDNFFYFSISRAKKINVLSIGKQRDFFDKIYTKKEFNYSTASLNKLNYNAIQNQSLIVLNELENIPVELANKLLEFSKNGGSLVIIPSSNISLKSYNQLFQAFQLGSILNKNNNEQQVTSINFDHPLLNDVFEKKVGNFEYPSVSLSYGVKLINSSHILSFSNNTPFVASSKTKNGNVYWIAAPLDESTTNFSQSSLIVPVFYNFAAKNFARSDLYYRINSETNIDVETAISKDEVLSIANENKQFIPLQNFSQQKVSIDLSNQIEKSGFYNIYKKDSLIKTIAFNYNRSESRLTYMNFNDYFINDENIKIHSSVDQVLNEIDNLQKINWLFKWFLAFSVLFLLVEILLLKYLKI